MASISSGESTVGQQAVGSSDARDRRGFVRDRKPVLLMALCIVAGCLMNAMIISSAHPVHAETGESTIASALGTVSLALRSPQQFTEARCLFIPLEVTWNRRADVTVVGELTVRKPGTSIANADSFLLAPNEPVAGTYTDYVYVCPADGPGHFVVSGTVSFFGADSSEVIALVPIAFTVVPARTAITGLKLLRRGSKVTVSGRAVITSPTSAIGPPGGAAGGILLISVREPGTAEWVNVAVPDLGQAGDFTATIAPSLAPGTLVRAQVIKCKWCTGAKAYARVN